MPDIEPLRVLIFTSKLSIARYLLASIRRTRPFPPGTDMSIVCTTMTGFYRFDYPAVLTSQDFPYVGDVMLRQGSRLRGDVDRTTWRENVGLTVYRSSETPSGLVRAIPDEVIVSPGADEVKSLLQGRDLVVNMGDAWYREEVAFSDAITLGGTQPPPDTRILSAPLYSVSDNSLDVLTALLHPDRVLTEDGPVRPWQAGNSVLLHGRAKDFFDWNWNLNARSLMARPLRRAGVPGMLGGIASIQLLSKYALQLILHLVHAQAQKSDAVTMTDGGVITLMSRWKGTGKYPPLDWSAFGSEMSRAAIIENLMALGLLRRTTVNGRQNGLEVTSKAVMLANLLPATAYDPDLPFRLDGWCKTWPRSRPAMTSYIRRYFGAVKRVDGMTSLSSVSLGPKGDATFMLAEGMSREAIAASAQISCEAVDAALQGEEIPAAQARGLALAALRLRKSVQN